MATAIQAVGLSKQYRLGEREPYRALRDSLSKAITAPFRRGRAWLTGAGTPPHDPAKTIWALNDVSFDVQHGEILGIIGRNGSGKSTLLKILSRVTEPTSGLAQVRGRVGSLLEVGTGFHPELTGRENVFVNGAILGMRRAEISRKFDEIVAFADVDRFIDTPVKHYSSGMQMRLAFAIAAHLEPEILLVDEVLAVGDLGFQKKCIDKMGDVAGEGRTVLFVSHDLTSVQLLCNRVVRLTEGRVTGMGSVAEQLAAYLAESHLLTPMELDRPYPLRADLRLVRLTCSPRPVESGNRATIVVELEASKPTCFDELALLLHDPFNRRVGVLDFRQAQVPLEANGRDNLRVAVNIAAVPLVEGDYRVGLSIRTGNSHQILMELVTLTVTGNSAKAPPLYRTEIRGMVEFDYSIEVPDPVFG